MNSYLSAHVHILQTRHLLSDRKRTNVLEENREEKRQENRVNFEQIEFVTKIECEL